VEIPTLRTVILKTETLEQFHSILVSIFAFHLCHLELFHPGDENEEHDIGNFSFALSENRVEISGTAQVDYSQSPNKRPADDLSVHC